MSICSLAVSIIQEGMNFSRHLESTGVREIGLRSVSSFVGGLTLGRGTMSTSFHTLGIQPSWRLLLKIAQTGLAKFPVSHILPSWGQSLVPQPCQRALMSSRSTSLTLMVNMLGTTQSLFSGMKESTGVSCLWHGSIQVHYSVFCLFSGSIFSLLVVSSFKLRTDVDDPSWMVRGLVGFYF